MANGNGFNTWRWIVSAFGTGVLIAIVALARFYFSAPHVYADKLQVQNEIQVLRVASAENDVRYGFIEQTLENIADALKANAMAQEKRDEKRQKQEERQFDQQQKQLDEIKEDIKNLEQ